MRCIANEEARQRNIPEYLRNASVTVTCIHCLLLSTKKRVDEA